MSNPIPIKRKFSAVNNKENIKYTNNFQQKKILNNKYKNHSQKDVSVPINSKLNNKIIEKYLNENNYTKNIFNEKENSKIQNKENGIPNPNNNNNNLPEDIIIDNNLINNQINNGNQEYITINDIIGEKCEINLDILRLFFNNFEQSKTSRKNMGVIKSYGVNTYQGIVRNYNEDRVSIIINMNKPKDFVKGKWPKTSFFGIYDGHGGEGCSEYLRDNLHKLICNNEKFPEDIPGAIKLGISKAEQDFLNNFALSENKEEIIDKSGSCAIIILIVDTNIYIANVGDSRCLLSMDNGNKYLEVTKDHKPNSPNEIIRIKKNGGNIYQSQTVIANTENFDLNGKILIGPYRVLPGRLSVSRTIGDAEAKLVKFGGNPNVIICEPEIYYYDLKKENIDFLILGCDGIYDQMSNKEVLDCAWMVIKEKENIIVKESKNIHNHSGLIVDLIIKSSLARKSFDNVTCLFVALKDLGIKEMEQNENNNEQNIKENGSKSDNGVAIQNIFPFPSPEESTGGVNPQNNNNKNNFEKIYTIKRRSNIISKKDINNLNNEETKCKTNRNDNRTDPMDNNKIMNNKIYNTDYKVGSLKLNNDIEYNKNGQIYNKDNPNLKDFNIEKNHENYRKIETKQSIRKENFDENENLSHNKYPSSNLIAYSKKNQSFNKKINKYLISLNNNNNSSGINNNNLNNTNYKQIKKTNDYNNYATYATKKISGGNIINRKNFEINTNKKNSNNSEIFKPVSKFNLNYQQPLKVIESKNSFTNSTKNLSLTNKNSIIVNNINNINKNNNQNQINHVNTKTHRYIITNKDNRNSAYITFNNNNINIANKINTTQNENIYNDKFKKKYVNLNEQYKFQSQLMNNSINSNNASYYNQNLNQRKAKKHLSINNPETNSNSMFSSNTFIGIKNINNPLGSRIKRDINSKIRQMSMQKSLPNNNFRDFRVNQKINGVNSRHNLSMQSIQLTNNMNNYNYGDKIHKMKTYKFNGDKNYQSSTNNSSHKINNYTFGKYNINNNNYLMTDLGRTKKEFLFADNKNNKFF